MTHPIETLRAIWLFLRIVGREIEPKSCGIPDPYRIRGRMGLKLSWEICNSIRKFKITELPEETP